MKHLVTVLMVVCLVVDMAMPLMPGAFRFNADESIEGVHARSARIVVASADRVPLPAAPMVLHAQRPAVRMLTRRVERNRGPWREAPPIRNLQPDPSPQAPEDH